MVAPEPAAETITPAAKPVQRGEPAAAAISDPWGALAAVQVALARGLEEAATELAVLARSGIDAASEASTALLEARTFAEAIEINAGLIRGRTDALIEGSAKLSEIAVRAANDVSRPFYARFGAGWNAATTG
jgi:hypothetical protein